MADQSDKDNSWGGSQGNVGGGNSGPNSGGGNSAGSSRNDSGSSGRGGVGSTGNSGGNSAGSSRSDSGSSGRGGVGSTGGGGGNYGGSPGGNANSGGGSGNTNSGRNNASGNSYAGQDRAPSTNTNGGGGNAGKTGYGWSAPSHSTERGVDFSLGRSPANPVSTLSPGGNIERGRDFSLGRTPTSSTGPAVNPSGSTERGRDFSLGRNPLGPSLAGPSGNTERERDFSLGRTLAGDLVNSMVSSRVTNTPPSGFDPNDIGKTIRSSLNGPVSYNPKSGLISDQQMPKSFDLGKLGINPNINPNRFAPDVPTAATGQQPFDLTSPPSGVMGGIPDAANHYPTPTNYTPGRFGMAVPYASGMTMAEELQALNEEMADPMTGMPRNTELQDFALEREQRPAVSPEENADFRAPGTYNPSTGIPGATVDPRQFDAIGTSWAGTETAPPAGPPTARQAEIQSMTDLQDYRTSTPPGTPHLGGVPMSNPSTPSTGPTGFGAAVLGSPVTPPGVTPPSITDVPVTGRPNLADVPKAQFTMASGKTVPTTDVMDRVAAAWAAKLGADNVRLTGTSGQRTTGGKGRHPAGRAIDYGVEVKNADGSWRSLDFGKQADLDLAREVDAIGTRDFGLQGFGVGNGYMSNSKIHHDIHKNIDRATQGYEWTSPSQSGKTLSQGYKDSRAANRAAYEAAGNAPTPQQSVASIMASGTEMTPQMAALNDLNQNVTATASTTPTPTARPDMAGSQTGVNTGTPGTGNYPQTPNVPTPTPAPRGTEAAAGSTVTTTAPGAYGFPPTPTARPQAPGFPSFTTPATGYKRGLGASVGAFVIDAIAAVAGGPVSLAAQGGAMLLTGDTIGGTVMDMAGGKYGPNQYQPGADDKYSGDRAGGAGSGGGKDRGVNNPTTIGQTPAVPPGPKTEEKNSYDVGAEAFITKYLDTSPEYQTPLEKWGPTYLGA